MKGFFILLVVVQVIGLLLVDDYPSSQFFHWSVVIIIIFALAGSIFGFGVKVVNVIAKEEEVEEREKEDVQKSIDKIIVIVITITILFFFPRLYTLVTMGNFNLCPYTLIEEGYKHPELGIYHRLKGWILIFASISLAIFIARLLFSKKTDD